MNRPNHILVAGLGNIFLGDDAFGCEVVRKLSQRALPAGVQVVDFGIRSYDLAFALSESLDVCILVDATPRGEPPGTLYLIEPDLAQLGAGERAPLDAHSLAPVGVLQMAMSLGGNLPARLYLLGCEPAGLEFEDDRFGLSEAVQAAVPRAVERLEALIGELLAEKTTRNAGLAPVGKGDGL